MPPCRCRSGWVGCAQDEKAQDEKAQSTNKDVPTMLSPNRKSLALLAVGAGLSAALGMAPQAGAEPGPDNPALPGCEVTGGSATLGGQTTDCASPGNVQIDATPEFIPGDEYGGFYGFPGFF